MIKPLMQIPLTIKPVAYDDKLVIRLNEAFDFEYIFKTSQLKVYVPAPKGNPVLKLLHDEFILSPEEREKVLTYITTYFELNQKEMIKEIIDGKSDIPIRPTI